MSGTRRRTPSDSGGVSTNAGFANAANSPAAAPEQGSSLWHDAWLRLRKNRLAVAGLVFLIFVAITCLLGPLFSAYGYEEQRLDLGASPPSTKHWLGTDTLGRDLLVRTLTGGRVSLGVGLAALVAVGGGGHRWATRMASRTSARTMSSVSAAGTPSKTTRPAVIPTKRWQ